ncbi:hypothetical protein WN943_010928 [Citrus x changshan-huyou]
MGSVDCITSTNIFSPEDGEIREIECHEAISRTRINERSKSSFKKRRQSHPSRKEGNLLVN